MDLTMNTAEAEEDSNGNISYSVVKSEHFAKVIESHRAILLTPKGGPLVKDVDFEVHSSIEKFNQANPNGKISVLVYCLVEGLDHETVRIVEEKGINSSRQRKKRTIGGSSYCMTILRHLLTCCCCCGY
jgi:hypothetical protein